MTPFSAESIGDQQGRQVIVTGANIGLGFRTAVALAQRGAVVTLACRDRERGLAAQSRVRELSGNQAARFEPLDLADLASVRDFAERWDRPLDLVINNAGVMATPFSRTKDGFEQQLGINHLGHFALNGLLLPRLRQSNHALGPRIVVVSSLAHLRGKVDFANLRGERSYRASTAYSQSKLANLFFAREFDRRLKARGERLAVIAAHPGIAKTNLMAGMAAGPVVRIGGNALRVFFQSDAAGALPQLFAATDPELSGGEYFGPGGLFEMRGDVARARVRGYVSDRGVAARLWSASEELTGVGYPDLPAVA